MYIPEQLPNMASSSIIALSPAHAGVFHAEGITQESTKKATEFLQKNHERYHIFFNSLGFHNHTAHYILTAWALDATPQQLERAYNEWLHVQRPRDLSSGERKTVDLSNANTFLSCFSKAEFFEDYIRFFDGAVARNGVKSVLEEYLFSGTELSTGLFRRLFASFLHPLIHLGFGLEFRQPAIVVEALAMTAVHHDDIGQVLQRAEDSSAQSRSKPMVDLIQDVMNSEAIRSGSGFKDGFNDEVTSFDAPEELISIAGHWQVAVEELEMKTAEMINVNAYFTGAAQRPTKKQKLDFFYMHNVNCSIFFTDFLSQDLLSLEAKVKLLAWKGRFDVVAYGSRGAPKLDLREIVDYKPKIPGSWEDLFHRTNDFDDDSHLSKLLRALANGRTVCEPFESKFPDRFPIKGTMWLQLAHMALDSMDNEVYFDRWIRGAGFDEEWEKVPDRACI
ncbi:hypothetical protein B0J14DRAFT_164803 [Halenospora varia]|nr:hypothetical protein B0J14DRAFT_164803 [Halenospora varia]